MAEDLDPSEHVPVLAGVAGVAQARGARRWRRIGLALLAVVVVAACLGWLGPREATATDGDGLTVTYPQVTRSGADSALTVEAQGVAPDASVVVEMPHAVFDRLGIESVVPAPATEAADGDLLRLTFAPSGSEEFSAAFTGRLVPRSELGAFTYEISVSGGGGEPLTASARTWVLP